MRDLQVMMQRWVGLLCSWSFFVFCTVVIESWYRRLGIRFRIVQDVSFSLGTYRFLVFWLVVTLMTYVFSEVFGVGVFQIIWVEVVVIRVAVRFVGGRGFGGGMEQGREVKGANRVFCLGIQFKDLIWIVEVLFEVSYYR